MNLIYKALSAGVMMTTMMTASAAVIETLVGDIDGFGGQTAPGAVGVNTGFGFNNATATDPAFTDTWLFEQTTGGAGESPIDFVFSYTLGGASATSATLSLMESGMSDGRGPWDVLFNGNLAGSIANGLTSTSTLHSFTIDVSWLTGSDQVSLVYRDTQFEGFAIDYSALTIQTAQVPLPGILPLVGIGALALAALRRRKV